MANNKVKPSNAGKGRGKGNLNKTTAAIKDMIEGALQDVGGRAYLARQAEENPSAFMGLLGKILPKDVNLGGQPNNPVKYDNMSDDELDKKIREALKL